MKKILFILFFTLLTIPALADYYIVNQDNIIVGKTSYLPSEADLSLRNEIAVEATEDIAFNEAEYRNGKIIKHIKTAAEVKAETEKKEIAEDEALIQKQLRKDAYETLKKEGIKFKKITEEDFK